jgi:methyl-accepting chemotaxis protein
MMDDVTQQNAALVEQASAAAQALTAQASNLTQLIARYRIGERRSVDAPRATPRPAASLTAIPAVERRAANRPLSGKKKPDAASPTPAPSRAAAAGADEDWKDF